MNDVWFAVTTAASGPASTAVRLTVTNVPAGGFPVNVNAVWVYRSANGPAGPFTELSCNAGPGNGPPPQPCVVAALAPST